MARKLFPSQLEDETIYLVVREHWFHLFLKILVWAFFAAVLIMFNRFAQTYLPGLLEGNLGQITRLFVQVYTLFLTLSLFLIFVFYYLNVQIITNIRIVDIGQEGLFAHTVSELHIDKIEDATSQTNGVFGTIFNYGDVYVQTAGTVERFEFQDVPNPAAIEKIILDLYEKNSNFAKEGKESS
ncbi:MAG TPA: PH domain-containing protein [Patescibacteria group bacterium]|nr:PH domain-containing protein [Patescibacteria group bacterium]